MRLLGRRLLFAGIGSIAGDSAFAMTPPSLMIFFSFGEARITPQAEATINQVVAIFSERKNARVTIVGHTDTAEASVPLSTARAVAAKMRLVEMGISPDRISIVARGDKDMLVQTPPGTREPQNRRVDFIVQ